MSKKLILIGGMPGSGKTHIGKEIAKKKSCVFIDKDTVSRFFTEAMLVSLGSSKNDRESDIYLSKVRDLEYDTMLKQAWENIQLNQNVICSAPFMGEFLNEKWLKNIDFEAKLNEASLLKLWINVDLPTARKRIIARNAGRDNWKIANWDTYIDSLPSKTPDDVTVIDNSATAESSLSSQIEAVMEQIK